MTLSAQMPAIQPHILTNLESYHSMLQRCACRAFASDRFDAAVKWQSKALELEITIGQVREAMKGAAQ